MAKEEFPELMSIWARIINKMDESESKKRDYGTGILISASEIHLIQAIGMNPGEKVTCLADQMGVTKGAVSQMANKLVQKKLVIKYSGMGNDKDVLLKLTESGMTAKKGHDRHHAMFIREVESSLGGLTEDQAMFLRKFLLTVEKCIDEYNKSGDR